MLTFYLKHILKYIRNKTHREELPNSRSKTLIHRDLFSKDKYATKFTREFS